MSLALLLGKTRLFPATRCAERVRGPIVELMVVCIGHNEDVTADIDSFARGRVYAEAKRAGREGGFFMFHLGHPEISARYNPVGDFSRITEVATRIAGQLSSQESAAFKEFVWRFVNVMARALVALVRKPDYEQINRYESNVEHLLVDYSRALDGPRSRGCRLAWGSRVDGDR